MGARTRRTFKVIGFGLAGLALLLVLAYVFRLPLFGGWIAGAIEGALGETLGGRYEVGAIDGTLLRDVHVAGLETVEAPTEGTVRGLALDELVLEYDLWELLFGDGVLAALRRVEVHGLDVSLHAGGDEEDDGTLPSLASPPLDFPLPVLDVDGRVDLRLGGHPLRVETVALRSTTADAIALTLADVFVGDEPVDGRIEADVVRRSPTALGWTSSTALGGVSLPRAAWQNDGRLDAVLDTPAGSLTLGATPARVRAASEGLDLARLPGWIHGVLPPTSPLPARGRLRGFASVTRVEPLLFDAELEVGDLAWKDWQLTRLAVVAHADDDGTVLLDRVDGEMGGAVLRLRDGRLDPTFAYGVRSVASIEATVPDLSRVVPGYERHTALALSARQGEGMRVEILRLDVDDELGDLRGRGWVDLPADPEDVEATRVALDVEAVLPDLGSLEAPSLRGGVGLAGRLEGEPGQLAFSLRRTAGDVEIEGRAIDALEADGRLVAFERLELDEARIATGTTTVRASGRITWAAPEPRVELDVRAEAEDIGSWVPDADVRGRVALEGRLEGPVAEAVLRARLEATALAAGDQAIPPLQATVEATTARVAFDAVAQDAEVGRIEAAGALDVASGALRVDRLAFEGEDVRVEAGEVQVDLAAGEARIASLRARQAEQEAVLEAPLVVRWHDGVVDVLDLRARADDWRIRSDRISITPADSTASVATLRVAGKDVQGALAGPATVRWSDEGVAVEDLAVEAFGGRIEGHAAWREGLVARLEATGLDPTPWIEGLEGRVDATIRVDGETGSVALRVPRLAYAGEKGTLAARVEQGATGGLLVRGLKLRIERGDEVAGEADLPWRLDARGLVDLEEVPPRLRLTGTLPTVSSLLPLEAAPGQLEVDGDAAGLRGRLRVPAVSPLPQQSAVGDAMLEFELTPEAGRVRLRLEGERPIDAEGEARIAQGFDWMRPEGFEHLLDAPLEGRLEVRMDDWKRVEPYVGTVRRVEGEVVVRVDVAGTLRAPRIEGEATARDAAIEISSAIPVVSSLDARLVWRDERLRIEQLSGELGYAPFEVGGEILTPFDGTPTFDVTLKGRNVLAARSDAMRLRTDADLRVRGPLDALATSGTVRVTSLLYVQPVSMSGGGPAIPPMGFRLFSIEEGPLSTMTFDVKVVADETIRVRNNLARGKLSADLVLRGTGKSPEPEGRVVTKQASVFLPVTTLHLDGAEIVFPPGDPFGPRVQATARSRASGYELGVRAMGRLPDLDVAVYSRPRLSDEDAMLLLATGATAGAAGSSGVQSVTFQKAVEFFGKNLFSYARATADPDERPFFDRFTLTIGREVSRRGNETVETELGLTDRVYVTFDRDRYDETNLGFVWRFRRP